MFSEWHKYMDCDQEVSTLNYEENRFTRPSTLSLRQRIAGRGSRRLQLLNRPAVDAGKSIPAHKKEFLKHFQAIFQVADARTLIMSPGNGYLANGIAALNGNKKYLRIKPPAFNPLQLKNSLRNLPRECLKAALRIGKRQRHDHARDEIKTAPEEAPIERLPQCLPLHLKPARANGNVHPLANCCEQQFCFLHGRRQIGVGEHDDISRGLQHAVAHCVSLAAIARIMNKPDNRIFGNKAFDDSSGVITRAIIDNQHFGIPAASVNTREHLFQGPAYTGLFVIGRYDDTVFGMHAGEIAVLYGVFLSSYADGWRCARGPNRESMRH